MNKKLLAIQVLKERISNMQTELNKLESAKQQKIRKNKSKSLQKSQDKSGSPFRNTSSNKRYKSPTFWTANPLLGQQNPYFRKQSISPKKKPQRNNSFVFKSPIIQKIQKQVDLNFYQSAPSQQKQKQKNSFDKQNKKNLFAKKQQRVYEYFRNVPRVQKKKTYDFPKRDPILNPQPARVSSKKICIKQCSSPKNIYIQNPNSNPNIYFYSTQPITLSPKAHNNRNNSPDLKLLLSNSAQNLGTANHTPKSHKKHYGKYYMDNLVSKWNLNW